ncbi:unnamed protein product [Dracunculus medinensis]|uniref:Anion exchange protein n=1 Tax=Dracunculus medinensis TaxID=318479 RepID=A0A158Q691_DRAME|nr:unnamed protein product [Dracunculus medinensis]
MRSAGGAFDSLRPVRKNSTGTMNMLADELTNDQLNSIGSYTENISGLDGITGDQQQPSFSSLSTQSSFMKEEPHAKHHSKQNKVLVELFDLEFHDKNGEWTETARWIKYEEDIEGADHHWGQPHVSFLSFHSLIQLRKCVLKGIINLDLNVSSFADICEHIGKIMKIEGMNATNVKQTVDMLRMKHPCARHSSRITVTNLPAGNLSSCVLASLSIQENSKTFKKAYNEKNWQQSFQRNNVHLQSAITEVDETESSLLNYQQGCRMIAKQSNSLNISLPIVSPPIANKTGTMKRCRPSLMHFMSNTFEATHSSELFQSKDHFSRKLPEGTEAAQVFVGTIHELVKPYFVMIRLTNAINTPELADGLVPTRFLFFIIGPPLVDVCYHELGRSIATLMVDKQFNEIAYDAKNREQLIRGIDGFLDDSIVIPPGEVDNKRLLSGDEIRRALKRRNEQRKKTSVSKTVSLKRIFRTKMDNRKRKPSYRFFSGLIEDINYRIPKYWSDYKDACNFQCLTAIVFMFFASFAPAITFGGLMGKYTNEKMGVIETLVAQCICGLIWGIFSAQPLVIIGATGPVLIFEASLNVLCESLNLDFFTVRLHAGIWVMLIATTVVALEGSQLLIYVTRFTEDIFASLISIIFIAESFYFIYQTFVNNPVKNFEYYQKKRRECVEINQINSTSLLCSVEPNTALLSIIILFCTFSIAYGLRQLRHSFYLGRVLRRAIGDFGILISIVTVAIAVQFLIPDASLALLEMPSHFDFTNSNARGHGIIISILLPLNWQAIIIAPIASVLVFILIFVETEITELLLTRKDRGLVKGAGMHWDLLLAGICIALCSIFGLPWMCAAAVQSLAHCGSLTVMRKTVPGERAEVDHVIEQRVTTIGVSLLIGLVAFAGSYLKLPLASLFGVFLYLGVMNLSGVQLIQRIILVFVPSKYFPVTTYTESVKVWRIHLFTIIQLICLTTIYLVKMFKQTSLAFPFVLILFVFLRQFVIPKIFTENEIKALDGDEDLDDDWVDKDIYETTPIPI